MEEKEQQMLLLAQALPAVAAQLRATLANMHAAFPQGTNPAPASFAKATTVCFAR